MVYQKFAPSAPLAPFVECYYVWENQPVVASPVCVEAPPSGYAAMVFSYGDPYRVRTPQKTILAPSSFLAGQPTHQYEMELPGKIGMVGIVFKPAGMNSLFGLPMYEFTAERVALPEVLGNRINEWHEQIHEADSPEARVAVLEAFLLRQLRQKGNGFDRTDFIADLIIQKHGIVTISDMMDDLYVCRRQFERQFLQKVGVSPKYYARICRFSFMCYQLFKNHWQVTDWQDLIYRAGYYDQSHFIREFTQFSGKPPTFYIRNHVELCRYLEA